MDGELSVLLISAASIGFFTTLFGPDHYLPLIALSKSGNWSLKKTALFTILSGTAHVISTVLLGSVGIAFGIAANKFIPIDSFRGNLAAWLLIAFGFVYLIWGIKQAIDNKPHSHKHLSELDLSHDHDPTISDDPSHSQQIKKDRSPWILILVFILIPCESLIPILMYPAAKDSMFGLAMVTLVFGVVTIGTMLGVVLISIFGLKSISFKKLERYSHAIAGGTILLSGLAIQFLEH